MNNMLVNNEHCVHSASGIIRLSDLIEDVYEKAAILSIPMLQTTLAKVSM